MLGDHSTGTMMPSATTRRHSVASPRRRSINKMATPATANTKTARVTAWTRRMTDCASQALEIAGRIQYPNVAAATTTAAAASRGHAAVCFPSAGGAAGDDRRRPQYQIPSSSAPTAGAIGAIAHGVHRATLNTPSR